MLRIDDKYTGYTFRLTKVDSHAVTYEVDGTIYRERIYTNLGKKFFNYKNMGVDMSQAYEETETAEYKVPHILKKLRVWGKFKKGIMNCPLKEETFKEELARAIRFESNALTIAFDWDTSKEGWKYWNDIHEKFQKLYNS